MVLAKPKKVPSPPELPTESMGFARVVALMLAHPLDGVVIERGSFAIHKLTLLESSLSAALEAGTPRLVYCVCCDGVALAEGDRVLVKNQNYEQYNGIYVASAGMWSRAKDALSDSELWNASMPVLLGTTNGGKYFWENTDPLTTAGDITFIEITPPVPAPRPFAGELNLKTEPERINQTGSLVTTPAHIFGYCRNLHGKQLASITLPNNQNIGILSAVVSKAPVIALDQGFESLVLGTAHLTGVDVMALTIVNESNIGAGGGPLTFFFADQPEKGSTTTPPTYTTRQVTVPMGQQTTIAYVAPDSSSQMTFYVQKPDDSCVGADCSTYLTDWYNGGDGAGTNSNYWAGNITPSLNSQKALNPSVKILIHFFAVPYPALNFGGCLGSLKTAIQLYLFSLYLIYING
jgi:hypothetical protein